ncbi:hypothetical protein CSOJ01_01059 [Colletotrichum sojae]|uniref:Uncharacterized protein n=1 Tax=Colletotrichum sojae TaxID=2175907 RepID=A0A8H6N592_9PEZI|nr:hypothetical protein CSOJ01_01059 [Colletotrichum sojae]
MAARGQLLVRTIPGLDSLALAYKPLRQTLISNEGGDQSRIRTPRIIQRAPTVKVAAFQTQSRLRPYTRIFYSPISTRQMDAPDRPFENPISLLNSTGRVGTPCGGAQAGPIVGGNPQRCLSHN